MFELIGYWGVVSIVTMIMLYPAVVLSYFISISFMGKVLNDKYKGTRSVDKYFEVNDNISINGKVVLESGFHVVLFVVSLVATILILIHASVKHLGIGDTMILFASKAGEVLAPAGVYVIVPLALYYGAIYITRKGIAVKSKLDTINTKLKEVE